MELIEYQNETYPLFQTIGNASQFSIPYAKHFCKGVGYDIGFCREEWMFPGAIGVDLILNNGYHANNLPDGKVDYIYSSHCLEHIPDWVTTLEYWISKIKTGGIIFMYLPDISQKYWRPWNNRKHKHCITREIMRAFLTDHNIKNIRISEIDLNNSFMVVGEV